jgi:hypothetical protein
MRLITHSGSAHADETLACAVLLASGLGIDRIERRSKVPEADLADPACFVLDIGDRLEPDLRNFDHHQLPGTAEPSCTFQLVLDWLGLYDGPRAWFPWLEPMVWVDSKGNSRTAKHFGWPEGTVERLESPVELALRDAFSTCTDIKPGDPVWLWLTCIGAWFLDSVKDLEARWVLFQKTGRIIEVRGFQVLFLDLPPGTRDPGLGLEQIRLRLGGDIVGRIVPDARGAGYAMKRFDDDPRLDFLRLRHDPRIGFVHAGGFLATTRTRLPEAELLELLEQAAGG